MKEIMEAIYPYISYIYYGFQALAILVGYIFHIFYAKKYKIKYNKAIIMVFLGFALMLIFNYFLGWMATGFKHFGSNNFIRCFILVPVYLIIACKITKTDLKLMCDMVAPYPCLIQTIGKIGCFLNGCCCGYLCIPNGVWNPRYNTYLYPIQIVEAIVAFIIAIIIIKRNKKRKYIPDGKSYPLMLILFGATRFILEFFRNNKKIVLGLSAFSFHSLFMMVVGIIVYLYIAKNENVKTNKN